MYIQNACTQIQEMEITIGLDISLYRKILIFFILDTFITTKLAQTAPPPPRNSAAKNRKTPVINALLALHHLHLPATQSAPPTVINSRLKLIILAMDLSHLASPASITRAHKVKIYL